jgi:FkbH-like protein
MSMMYSEYMRSTLRFGAEPTTGAPIRPHDGESAKSLPPQPEEAAQPDSSGEDRNLTMEQQLDFDEKWYLDHNKDVAAAVAEGRCTALEHYLLRGRVEGRQPLPPDSWVKGQRLSGQFDQDADPALRELFPRHNGAAFLNPTDLTVTTITPKRVAFIGSCLLGALGLHQKNPSGCDVDLLTVNNADPLPEQLSPGVDVSSYDFVFIQIPLRAIFHDTMLSVLDYGATEAYEDAFKIACQRLRFHLECRMEWNVKHGLLSFVSNFFVPQRNMMGSLFPRFDLRNPEYFVSRLNEELEALVRGYKNAYILDVDRISASIGRSYTQDDSLALTSHASVMGFSPWITDRIEPIAPVVSHYDIRWHEVFPGAVWAELISMFRVVRQVDAVKLVVVDLDDTLWLGVSGDISDVGPHMLEGWPLGLVEALSYLKKRGILLAIVSKNEEQRVRAIWPKIFGNRLSLDDFAAVFVNWRPKPDNMRELLEIVNLLPRNVLFIDDNPAERAAMNRAFPDMRILGRHPYYLRRILLWSSETQVPSLTKESARRTEMIQAQVLREGERKQFAREDFLREAAPQVTMMQIDSMDHPRFPRAFELLNKTNQYNTTGRRWTVEEFRKLLQSDTVIQTFEVVDKYTDYGLVGVIIVSGSTIEQWVMSCRVLGYQIEDAVMANIVQAIRAKGVGTIVGRLVETDVNFPCRSLFSKCGFAGMGERWILEADQDIAVPGHVTIRELETAG